MPRSWSTAWSIHASISVEHRLRVKGIIMRYNSAISAFVIFVSSAAFSAALFGQEPTKADSEEVRFERFTKTMSGSKLVGHFTITGQDNKDLAAEEYHIHEVKKLDEGDYWMIKARIKYGGRDVTVPLPLEVKWAANTPVITLDEVEIPLMGKFSSRVLFDGNKYAGTWSHGEVGGHLFGEIVPNKAEEEKPTAEKTDKK